MSVNSRFRRGTQKDELRSLTQRVINCMVDEMNAFLVVQTTDKGNNRLVRIAQEQPIAQSFFSFGFSCQIILSVVVRNVAIALRIPHIIINAVEHPAKLVLIQVQSVTQTVAKLAVVSFPSVVWRNSGNKVRVNNAAFDRVESERVRVSSEAIVIKIIILSIQTRCIQNIATSHALMFEIVNGIADSLIFHPIVFVNFKQQDWNQTSLSIVTVNYIGTLVASEQKFQRRFAEKCKPHIVVIAPVITAAIKKVILRARFDEKTQLPVHPAAQDIAEDFAAVPRHSQIPVGLVKSPNMVVPHAVVLR